MESVPKKFSAFTGMIHHGDAPASSFRLVEVSERDDFDGCIGTVFLRLHLSVFHPLATSRDLAAASR